MRNGPDAMKLIEDMMVKFKARHKFHMELYGDNSKRMTGSHETSSKDEFSYGIGNRAASVRISTNTASQGKGYIEDRRPASDIDPYVVTAVITDTSLLDGHLGEALYKHYKVWLDFKAVTRFET